MKSKKLLGFISAIMGVCLSVTSFVGMTAFAEETTTTYKAKDGNITDCASVPNSLADYFETADGQKIDVKKVEKDKLEVWLGGSKLTEGYDFDATKGTITFRATGTYTVKVTFSDDGTDALISKDVEVVSRSQVTPVTYEIDSAKILEFNAKVQEAVTALDADATSVAIPDSFWDYVSSNVFGKSDFRTKVYVSSPAGSFSAVSSTWSSSLSKINLSKTGTYYFYVEVKDPCYNEVVKSSDYKLKADGWYKETTPDDPATPDVDESEYNELVIPVFSFNYTKVETHKIEIDTKVEEGIVGQEFTYVKATVTASNKTTVKLYYNPNVTDKLPGAEGASGWIEAVNGEHAEYDSLSVSSTKFTPLVKGSFCLYVESRGGESGYDVVEEYSKIISVNKEIQQQKLVNDAFAKFLKNNWLSVVFLGIALLCIVGIIILAFYKPKDETPAPKKKEKVEDAEDKKDETEDVEDATEETEDVEDVTEESEVEEAPANETETGETPAQEVEETPAEDAPVAEEKADGENA
ncbi:MAG: hypothetical protein IJW64_00030 [Clostridia bacterium]|nr:hypothetical protein [Clostridia bacterium]